MNEGKDEDGKKKYRLGMLLRIESPLLNFSLFAHLKRLGKAGPGFAIPSRGTRPGVL
jgi:hypothetical protein